MTIKSPSNYLLNSLCINPDIRFETQKSREKIVLLLRAHPITLLPSIFNGLVAFLLLVIFDYLPLSFISFRQYVFFNLTIIVFILSYFWFSFIGWFFNVGIVTTERIIDIDYHHITYREITQAKLGRVEDITTKTGGFLKSFFNYGNIFVQTAGEEKNIEFFNVPRPTKVVQVINNLLEK